MCPFCGKIGCYRQISPYFRYAVELFPEFEKQRIPIARFLCRKRQATFSLLPIQLIPYFQYTVTAVLGALLLGYAYWQMGYRGFYGASVSVDADSLVTPYLIVCWLTMVVRGFRRAHAVLRRFYDLSDVHTLMDGRSLWKEVSGYFLAFGLKPQIPWTQRIFALCRRYSRSTNQFLFGVPSQRRTAIVN